MVNAPSTRGPVAPAPVDDLDELPTYRLLARSSETAMRVYARTELAPLLEQRGALDEATECYERNIADGLRDADQCERLAELYRRLASPGQVGAAIEVWGSSQPDQLLEMLRSGGAQTRYARAGLARIFEGRGLLEQAAECYEGNIADGVRDPDQCGRLATLYRRMAEIEPIATVSIPGDGTDVRLPDEALPNEALAGLSGGLIGASAQVRSWLAWLAGLVSISGVADRSALLTNTTVQALLYVVAIAAAEVLTVLNPQPGVTMHGVLMLVLLTHGSVAADERRRVLLWGFALAPLIRISSLTLPLHQFPPLYWYAIISIPIFASTFVAARMMGYSMADVGLTITPRSLVATAILAPVGALLGLGEYVILHPEPLSRELSLASLWLPALILSVSTGLEEELLFRGLLQKAAVESIGPTVGLIIVSLLFAVLRRSGTWSATASRCWTVSCGWSVSGGLSPSSATRGWWRSSLDCFSESESRTSSRARECSRWATRS